MPVGAIGFPPLGVAIAATVVIVPVCAAVVAAPFVGIYKIGSKTRRWFRTRAERQQREAEQMQQQQQQEQASAALLPPDAALPGHADAEDWIDLQPEANAIAQ